MSLRTRIALTVLATCAALAIVVPFSVQSYNTAHRPPVVITLHADSPVPVTKHADPALTVDVVGAVQRPGLYALHSPARAIAAIHAAGGFLKTADSDAVNLAAPLSDGDQVVVPQIGEDSTRKRSSSSSKSRGRKKRDARSTKLASLGNTIIDINTASVTELQRLPGVGAGMAQRIVSARAKLGPFRAPSDLQEVAGIGQKKFAKLKAFIKT